MDAERQRGFANVDDALFDTTQIPLTSRDNRTVGELLHDGDHTARHLLMDVTGDDAGPEGAGTPLTDAQVAGELERLYQEYVGHDNNRDAYMLNMIESRAIEHTWRQWEPQIIYVQHQSGPFPTRIWLPPFSEPVGVEAPPIEPGERCLRCTPWPAPRPRKL